MKRIHVEDINTPEHYEKLWAEKASKGYFDKERHKALIEFVKIGDIVLDLGAGLFGSCEYLRRFKPELWCDCYCLDYSPFCKKHIDSLNLNIHYEIGNVLNTPYPDNFFDVVMSGEVIEHMEDPSALVKEMVRICKDDGYIVITTVDTECEAAKKIDYPEHLWEFTKEDLISFFEPYGETIYGLVGNYHKIILRKSMNSISLKKKVLVDIDRTYILSELLKTFCKKTWPLLDVAAGHGMFSIAARDLGFNVTSMDARTMRTPTDLIGINWITDEVEKFDYNGYDIVLLLGILYHLPLDEQIKLFDKIKDCKICIIDTHLCMNNCVSIDGIHSGSIYVENTNIEDMRKEPRSAYNNLKSFWPNLKTLKYMLNKVGFNRIYTVIPYFSPNRTFIVALNKNYENGITQEDIKNIESYFNIKF